MNTMNSMDIMDLIDSMDTVTTADPTIEAMFGMRDNTAIATDFAETVADLIVINNAWTTYGYKENMGRFEPLPHSHLSYLVVLSKKDVYQGSIQMAMSYDWIVYMTYHQMIDLLINHCPQLIIPSKYIERANVFKMFY